MSRLLFVFERDMPTVSSLREVFLHVPRTFPELSCDFRYLTEVSPSDVDSHDIVVLIRPNCLLSASLAKKARAAGCLVATFCDDDLLTVRPAMPWRTRGLRRTLSRSDLIWSSNQSICDKYLPLTAGKRQAITDTVVHPEQLQPLSKKEQGVVKLVYAASPSHLPSFEQYVRPVLPELLSRFGRRISMTFISVRPELSEFDGMTEIRYVPGMPLQQYRDYMSAEQFDVGIAPLPDTEFTRCKYFNKYIEYTMSGVFGIYSNVVPYSLAVRDHVTGLLADNTYDGWFNALSEAVADADLRRRGTENAQADLRENFTEERIVTRLTDSVPELLRFSAARRPCGSLAADRLLYRLMRPADWLYLSFYYLKNGGIRGFIKRFKMHFREKNAYAKKKETES